MPHIALLWFGGDIQMPRPPFLHTFWWKFCKNRSSKSGDYLSQWITNNDRRRSVVVRRPSLTPELLVRSSSIFTRCSQIIAAVNEPNDIATFQSVLEFQNDECKWIVQFCQFYPCNCLPTMSIFATVSTFSNPNPFYGIQHLVSRSLFYDWNIKIDGNYGLPLADDRYSQCHVTSVPNPFTYLIYCVDCVIGSTLFYCFLCSVNNRIVLHNFLGFRTSCQSEVT